MNTPLLSADLHRLARLYQVQTSYYGVDHRRRPASPESLFAVLRALGAPLISMQDVPAALRERRLALRRRVIEPVSVLLDGREPQIAVVLPDGLRDAEGEWRLETEDGEVKEWRWRAADLPPLRSEEVEGERFLEKALRLPGRPPHGYHRLRLRLGGEEHESLVISAPLQTYRPPGEEARRWGAFLPLYALRTGEGWGGADFTSLGKLARRVAGLGGSVVGTLPLLPVFLERPFEPSPYAPVSRRLWNEFYVDVTRAPGFQDLSEDFREQIDNFRASRLIDYTRLMELKRRIMEQLCHLQTASAEIERFARENPTAADYACFRAAMESRGAPWPEWPQPLRDGVVQPGDYDEAVRRYHLYAQLLAWRQVDVLAAECRGKGVKLYFDLPLGVHPLGFDVWQHRGDFALEASAGAPPDAVFTRGQDWRFHPLHPEAIRTRGYRYVIDYLHHQLRHADMLRIDHIMGLHRLFWVPRGLEAARGVYVHYRAEEFYAILAVESHRHRCVIIGEDLGTVPPYVRPAMKEHGVRRMYILQYALVDKPVPAPGHVPAGSLAALNTHDMPPFAAFWQDDDFMDRLKLGLLDEQSAAREKKERRVVKDVLVAFLRRRGFLPAGEPTTRKIVKACLAYFGASRAGTVLVNLEDLWLETEPQNVPSINEGYPNWRRRARYTMEEIFGAGSALEILGELDRLRRRDGK